MFFRLLVKVIAVNFTDISARDTIRIYDGKNESTPLITSLYGPYSPPPGGYMSTQMSIYITFNSDTWNTLGGFNFTYWAVKGVLLILKIIDREIKTTANRIENIIPFKLVFLCFVLRLRCRVFRSFDNLLSSD